MGPGVPAHGAPESPYTDPGSELAMSLRAGLAAGRRTLEAGLRHGASPEQNGWKLTYHVFDYNLDFFELGALDEDRWKMPEGGSGPSCACTSPTTPSSTGATSCRRSGG